MAYLTTAKAREEAGGQNASQMPSQVGSQVSSSAAAAAAAAAAASNRQMGYNRFDQERYAAKDETGGFSIDTKLTYQPNGGALSLANNTSQSSDRQTNPTQTPTTQLATQKANIMPPGGSSQLPPSSSLAPKAKLVQSPNQPVKRVHVTPIIIVPNTNSSIITLFNCLDLLQELKYVRKEKLLKKAFF